MHTLEVCETALSQTYLNKQMSWISSEQSLLQEHFVMSRSVGGTYQVLESSSMKPVDFACASSVATCLRTT